MDFLNLAWLVHESAAVLSVYFHSDHYKSAAYDTTAPFINSGTQECTAGINVCFKLKSEWAHFRLVSNYLRLTYERLWIDAALFSRFSCCRRVLHVQLRKVFTTKHPWVNTTVHASNDSCVGTVKADWVNGSAFTRVMPSIKYTLTAAALLIMII